ncbi:probable flavin-containing monooxygenase 1 [Impatiens glandulifera]|uniref:probable flavin-containing monooxygenase 1 n=1 Tax=Impatiens glandulifera TaxID=253017 RepID=UPI001FB1033E|nr:probable flavin-containing monooxygenase 1 [Impatiens glandulifera]
MEKNIAIIGAGISGLLACKYILEKGFNPVVFEAEDALGGVWYNNTIESTRIQNQKHEFQFSDFPWPPSVKDLHPDHSQVLAYVESYAKHFDLFRYIRFGSKVNSLEYVGVSEEEMRLWDLWGGTGKAFNPRGKWQLVVEDTKKGSLEEYKFDFVILCIGRHSGLPNIPEFPPEHDTNAFKGKVVHSMEYSAMDSLAATKLIKGKKVAVIGSKKCAVDVTTQCSNVNGVDNACTMIQRTVYWMVPISHYQNTRATGFLLMSRFSELMVHKPGEHCLHSLLATLFSPLRWCTSKIIEKYLKHKLPLKKYGMIPKHGFLQQYSSCQTPVIPDNFYDKVIEGSILLKKSQNLSFCYEGVIIDGQDQPVKADVVILATGFRGDDKLKNIFGSTSFQKCIKGLPNTARVPLYREIIQPRVPQLAVIGYTQGRTALHSSEIGCQWISQFLGGSFDFPSIMEMEKEVMQWEEHARRYAGKSCWRSFIALPIWYNDQMCKDMGCDHRRKKGVLKELFGSYGPSDYAGLVNVRD